MTIIIYYSVFDKVCKFCQLPRKELFGSNIYIQRFFPSKYFYEMTVIDFYRTLCHVYRCWQDF